MYVHELYASEGVSWGIQPTKVCLVERDNVLGKLEGFASHFGQADQPLRDASAVFTLKYERLGK